MTGSRQLESLEGQQYLVLRPTGAVAEFYDAEQSALLRGLPASITHPDAGHVTLRGFSEPERVDALRSALAAWAAKQPPVDMRVCAIDGFPPPFQVIIARAERSPSLVDAYASLTTALDATDFDRIGELPLDEWVFHLSLAYAGTLDERAWGDTLERRRREIADGPTETIAEVEFVWYRAGVEHAEVLPLGSKTALAAELD